MGLAQKSWRGGEKERLMALMDAYNKYKPDMYELLIILWELKQLKQIKELKIKMGYLLCRELAPMLAIYGEPEDIQAVKSILDKIETFSKDIRAAMEGASADKMNKDQADAGRKVVGELRDALIEVDTALISRLREVAQGKGDISEILKLYKEASYQESPAT